MAGWWDLSLTLLSNIFSAISTVRLVWWCFLPLSCMCVCLCALLLPPSRTHTQPVFQAKKYCWSWKRRVGMAHIKKKGEKLLGCCRKEGGQRRGEVEERGALWPPPRFTLRHYTVRTECTVLCTSSSGIAGKARHHHLEELLVLLATLLPPIFPLQRGFCLLALLACWWCWLR